MSRPLGLYQPGNSPLHRAPAGGKLLGLLVFATVVMLFDEPVPLAVAAGAVLAGFVTARIRPDRVLRMTGTLLVVLGAIFALQSWLLDPKSAAVVCLRLLTAISAANLFTLTTRIDDLVSAVERGLAPARRLGLRPETFGLLVGLTVQAVGVLATIAAQTREAQRARDASRSVSAFAVPFLIRTLRHADELGEALAARGVGDAREERSESPRN
ncbi:energy-coupling factor transporter transmembrane component T family protein [Actinopolyspora mortivallis]|uniref:energy-coupling factor transporter transmembrane component T family protein n=1 Tax=Actinopolyspora mortivallis TaxID=33906 RepID=UPI000363787B|nr:energy-coupling factor transporter transmembrane protein EcfT [Actinopolyspora mortivallis]